ncbi:serine O-acetyltransferase EpsC [Dactylosporangium sp. NPDC051484]|uniref:serine O-acetyltransferase EpsC n=1 Tax=Dactylosporangium sp. NPDC051484 TaxID=3154942 RepID=UPI00344D6B24
MRGRLAEDIDVVLAKDPAARSRAEVLLYPHLHAIWLHRIGHWLYRHGHRLLARAVGQFGRFVSGGIEIHPGARVGRRLFIDHGCGVVIGETAVVGDDVMLYHGVTLGSVGWAADRSAGSGTRRHPTVGNNVVLGARASVLGPVSIGDGARVGAHAVVLTDLPAQTTVPAGAVVRRRHTTAAYLPVASTEGLPDMSRTSGQVLITCAPPNPNGDLHLGHLSGPFLGADVLRRYLCARGVTAHYVSYTDDESCYVPRRATELGTGAKQTAHRFTRRIEQTLALADMLPDYYAHPHREPRHAETVQAHFLRLYQAGLIEERVMATPYCEPCQRYLYEADLRGQCRFCGLACDGTYCEDCGFPQDPQGIRNARCIRCSATPVSRPSSRLVLVLSRHADALRGLYQKRSWSPRIEKLCEELLELGLPDTPISRIYDYGVAVPLAGWEGHVLDTWYSGIYGYMAATEGLGVALGDPGLARSMWHDPETTLVHFIGFDCGFSHAVLWPALLEAENGLDGSDLVQPRHIISNEFYHLEGEKFSTSRGHAIWGSDFLRSNPADALRFHLCRTNPEREPTNFFRAEYEQCYTRFLSDQLEGWAATLFDGVRAGGGSIPESTPQQWPGAVRELIERLPGRVADALEPATFSLRRAAQEIESAVAVASSDLARSHGDMAPEQLAAHTELLAVLAAVAAPLIPTWSARVWSQLQPSRTASAPPWPEPGQRLLPAGTALTAAYQPIFAGR